VVSQAISHYRIIKKLGVGGMGEVYLAEDTLLGRKVAIKLLLPRSAGDEHARKRLRREARAAAKLDHANICAIYEVGEDANGTFIVMQYVEGETLAGIIHKRHLELTESLDIATQILSALSEAHSKDIIHRDIKPQNVIVTPRGQVKVLDFGLAKIVQQDQPVESEAQTQSILTEAGMVMGTAAYMSPEQAKGADLDARSDLFSLGALLYECVTWRPPFTGNNLLEICGQVMHVNPRPPSSLNPHVPPELDRIMLRALAKEADVRYQSADELLEDLRRVRHTPQAEVKMPAQPVPLGPARLPATASAAGVFEGFPPGHDTQAQRQLPSQSGALEKTTSRIRALATISNILQKKSPTVAVAMIVILIAFLGYILLPSIWPRSPREPLAEAKRFYDAGTNALRDGAYYQASKALELAISRDDSFALAHARLAEALTELDYSDRAKDELLRVTTLVTDRSALPRLEALYLRAITDTATREFASAIESYRLISEQVPEPEKAFAYVDLGRAYEKNEDVKTAIESYEEAARRDKQYAAPFLRLGILQGRQQELPTALDAFDRAQSIYEGLSNLEGVTEVLYQRGSLLNKIGKLAEARAQQQQVLDLSQRTKNKFQQIRALLQFCSISYTEGNTTRGKEYAAEAMDLARANNLENLTAQSLIDLGGAFYVRREYTEAEKYFRQALEFAQANKGRRNEAMALLCLGRLYIHQDVNTEEALRDLNQALAFFQEGGYKKEVSIALLLRGRAKLLKGDYGGALEEFEDQLLVAKEANDPSQIAVLHGLIGRTLADQELYPDALRHFEEAYALYNSSGNQLSAGYSLLDRGDMLSRLGRYEEGRESLNRVTLIADHLDSNYRELLLARVQVFSSQMALSQRLFSDAREKGRQALTLLGTKYDRTVIEAKYTLGLAQSFSGAKREGKQLCQEASDMAPLARDPRVSSIVLLALAEAALESGVAKNALETAMQAQERFSSAGQKESEWRALLIAGLASLRLKDFDAARGYSSRAESVLLELQQKWGAESFNSYIARPDIQLCRKQLSDALARGK